RAGEDACRDRQPAEPGNRGRAPGPGDSGARARRRHRAADRYAAGIRRAHSRRDREVGQGHQKRRDKTAMSPVIDVHTHMLNNEWLRLLEKHGRPYSLKTVTGGLRAIHLDGAPFMTPVPEMFDWDLRLKNMDRVGIDVSVVSLSCPNVYWGGEKVSL